MFDKFHEECALVGVWDHSEAANLAYLALYSQQHRGQEGAGVLALNPDSCEQPAFQIHRGLGLVSDVFSGYDFSTNLIGSAALGHVRYTTAGASKLYNVQPFFAEIAPGRVGLAHNGNLVNADDLREELIQEGAIFGTNSDSEVFLHLLARAPKNVVRVETVISALSQVRGAYALLLLFEDRLFAIRDPHGFRPLSLASLNGGYVLASETCAFDLIGAKFIRDIQPGEIFEMNKDGETHSYFPFGVKKEAPCIFEYVYFSRPDSEVFGSNVYNLRKEMGRQLARECGVPADIVVPVPDSGVPAAIGYGQEARLPFELGLIRNHYVGRTFIEPKQSIRDFGVKIKLNANSGVIKGQRVVVVDDSIVRGTTSKKLVKMFRMAGAKEVHLRISAPPTTNPCFYGVDTPEKDKLIASRMSVDEIADFLGVDSLAYLSIEGLYQAVGTSPGRMCDACFSGEYPVNPFKKTRPKQEELFE